MKTNFLPALVFGLSAISAIPAHAEDKKAEQIHVRGSIGDSSRSFIRKS
ncbi:hypothetical protein GR197_15155 [Rhizobium phaseoli]|uniref:Uncharacterized protein n=1 Tax=Rhizobium phaseoli TaxID=396 RepID=A0A7K3UEX9_9HYPH|nr:hypothetical protein [Rhizobium phaseoli]NEJ71864.1 hypothetical protein [Rhizobium phaseoli]